MKPFKVVCIKDDFQGPLVTEFTKLGLHIPKKGEIYTVFEQGYLQTPEGLIYCYWLTEYGAKYSFDSSWFRPLDDITTVDALLAFIKDDEPSLVKQLS